MPNKFHRGFTLLEMMITLAIIATLGLITVPVLKISQQRVKEQELRVALRDIRTAIDTYKKAVDDKQVDQSTDSGYPTSLEVLVEGVAFSDKNRKGKLYFLRRLPRDPMNPKAELSAAQTWGKRSYASEADSPSEGADVYDVYSLSDRVGLNGVAYATW